MTRAPVAHDPAPTVWAYRMQRVMLTPYLRTMLRVGLPICGLALAVTVYLGDEARRNAAIGVFTDLREKFEQRPEFMVSLISIEGSTPELGDAVRARLDLNLPKSSFDLDLEAARARVEELDAVKSAELRVRSGGILSVIITERQPVLVWRQADGLTMVDETGHRVAGLFERGDRADLPLIAGQGADVATPEALQILAAAGPIASRVRGLVRMGERRWDIVLDRDQRILLPEDNPVRALERLLALDKAQDMLARDLASVDLRLPTRPTLRLTPFAMNEMRRGRGLDPLPETVETEL
nr:cell division protein FtsQ/DivIB [Pseudogemmobacter hezensis]